MRSESAVLISAAGGRQGRGRDRPNARNALETLDDWVVPGPTHQVRLEIPDPGLQIAQLLGQRRRGVGVDAVPKPKVLPQVSTGLANPVK
jgi:hypothetical protein